MLDQTSRKHSVRFLQDRSGGKKRGAMGATKNVSRLQVVISLPQLAVSKYLDAKVELPPDGPRSITTSLTSIFTP
jgi:hypothetical protein